MESKSKVTAILLAVFVGAFGAHNFYLGYTRNAVIQLILTIVGLLTMILLLIGVFPMIAVGVWVVVDIIRLASGSISTDAHGNPLV